MVLRVVLADDNYLVRQGLSALLAETDGVDLVDTATDLDSLIRSVKEHSPAAVLTDIRMPPTHTNEGIEAAKRIRAEHPDVGVVVLSQYVEEDYAFELLSAGVAGMGYLLRSGSATWTSSSERSTRWLVGGRCSIPWSSRPSSPAEPATAHCWD